MTDTTNAELGICEQSQIDALPGSPAFLGLPFKNADFKLNPNFLESEDISRGAQTYDIKRSGYQPGGTVNGEFPYPTAGSAMHVVISHLMRNDWTAITNFTSATFTFVESTKSMSVPSGDPFANLEPGHDFYMDNPAGDNKGWFRVATKTDDNTITVVEDVADESAGNSVTIKGQNIRNGTTKKFAAYERKFDDALYQLLIGGIPVGGSLTWANNAINQYSLSLMGVDLTEDTVTADATSSYTPAPDNPIMDGNVDLDKIFEGGSLLVQNRLSSLTLNFNNNGRPNAALGSEALINIGLGKFQLTANVSAYFDNFALYSKFRAATDSNLFVEQMDSLGNRQKISILAMKYTDGSIAQQGQNSDVMFEGQITGKRHPAYLVTFQIAIAPAA